MPKAILLSLLLALGALAHAECEPKVVDYTFVCNDDAEGDESIYYSGLIKAVNKMLSKGWVIQGSPFTIEGTHGTNSLCQALVKYKCKEEPKPAKVKAEIKPLTVDVNDPYRICLIDGEAHNCNVGDPYASNGLDPKILEIYIAIKNQTGAIDNITLLIDRHEAIPVMVPFSTSGSGCPHGIISYCDNIRWMMLVKGKWTLVEEK